MLSNIFLKYDYFLYSILTSMIWLKYTDHRHIFNDYNSHTATDVKSQEPEFDIDTNSTFETFAENFPAF